MPGTSLIVISGLSYLRLKSTTGGMQKPAALPHVTRVICTLSLLVTAGGSSCPTCTTSRWLVGEGLSHLITVEDLSCLIGGAILADGFL